MIGSARQPWRGRRVTRPAHFERGQRDAHRGTAKTKAFGNLLLGDELAGLDFAADQRDAQPANGLRNLRVSAR